MTENEKPEIATESVPMAPAMAASKPTTLNIIGCGGAGINLVRQLRKSSIPNSVSLTCIDASRANCEEGEEALIIGDGSGSGGVRATNADTAAKRLAELSNDEFRLADVNIVIFSLAGGSGSVIGPLVVAEIARRTQPGQQRHGVLAFCIADTSASSRTDNTMKTLQTLQFLSAGRGPAQSFYLPISVFRNLPNDSRAYTDVHMLQRLMQTVALIHNPTFELDRADRMSFIDGTGAKTNQTGVRMFRVISSDEDEIREVESQRGEVEVWREADISYVDAVITIAQRKVGEAGQADSYEHLGNSPLCGMKYEGHFISPAQPAVQAMISADDSPIGNLITHLNDTMATYSAHRNRGASMIPDGGKDNGSGIIL